MFFFLNNSLSFFYRSIYIFAIKKWCKWKKMQGVFYSSFKVCRILFFLLYKIIIKTEGKLFVIYKAAGLKSFHMHTSPQIYLTSSPPQIAIHTSRQFSVASWPYLHVFGRKPMQAPGKTCKLQESRPEPSYSEATTLAKTLPRVHNTCNTLHKPSLYSLRNHWIIWLP